MTAAELHTLLTSIDVAPRDQVLPLDPPVLVDAPTLAAWFPDHHVLPPPPPGFAPADAAGVFVANRPWGQLWFALHHGDRVVQLTVLTGRHHAHGV